jgi:hypothetical protein
MSILLPPKESIAEMAIEIESVCAFRIEIFELFLDNLSLLLVDLNTDSLFFYIIQVLRV